MKKVITESLKLFTLVGCVFVMFSCGGNDCVTCTKADSPDEEICEMDGDLLDAVYNAAVIAKEAEGFTCE